MITPQWTMPRDVTRLSTLEASMLAQIHAAGLPEPVLEYQFEPRRRWRLDIAYPDLKVAVECEGGVHTGGRHTRGTGFEADAAKYNEAALQGWLIIRATASQIDDGTALEWLERAMERRAE